MKPLAESADFAIARAVDGPGFQTFPPARGNSKECASQARLPKGNLESISPPFLRRHRFPALIFDTPRNDGKACAKTRIFQGQSTLSLVSSPTPKNISVVASGKSPLEARPFRARSRGASRSSRTLGAGCDGREAAERRTARLRGRRSRVVLTPRR